MIPDLLTSRENGLHNPTQLAGLREKQLSESGSMAGFFMRNTKIKIGVIGAGFISNYHIPGLQSAGAEVAVISSRNEENARRQAERYGIPTYTTEIEDILRRDDINAVAILTPDFTHKEYAIEAARAGKAIFLQKPMALNSSECREIISEAKKVPVTLYVSFMHRYFEEVEKVRTLLAENAIGRVLSIRQRNATPGANWADWFFDKGKVGGGVIMQLGVHGIDLLRLLFGEIQSVKAATDLMVKERILADGSRVKPNNEDFAVLIYRFASGAIAVHEVVYNEAAGTDRFRMEIYGEEGTALLRTERGRLSLYSPRYLGYNGWFTPDLPESNYSYRQHRHFLDILKGEAPLDDSAAAGLSSVLVAEAAYRSAAKDEWEEVKL
jgi:predicted dehydrogenase